MPSNTHEVLVELFHERPALAPELLAGVLGIDVPTFAQVRIESAELTDMMPTEWRSDGVVALADSAGQTVMGVVVEVQRRRDQSKRVSWPVYVATARARLGCPVILLVVCPDAGIAAWCAAPIELGHPGFVLRPLVLGPDRVPVVTDPEQARRVPELAVLSALVHGDHPEVERVLGALLAGLDVIEDKDDADLYTDVVYAGLPEAARRYLEALMKTGTYEPQSDIFRRHFRRGKAEGEAKGKAEGEAKGKAEGEAKGKAEGVLAILAARGVDVPDDARTRIAECTDLDRLDAWIRRAATATSVHDLFD